MDRANRKERNRLAKMTAPQVAAEAHAESLELLRKISAALTAPGANASWTDAEVAQRARYKLAELLQELTGETL